MIIIRFPDKEAERQALGYLAGRFSFKAWASGDLMLPAVALAYLAQEGIRFSVEGPAKYEHFAPGSAQPAQTGVVSSGGSNPCSSASIRG